jgi:hypothetical protein
MKKFFAKHRKIKGDINNKRFPVRDISVNFRFGFGLHFLPTTDVHVIVSVLASIVVGRGFESRLGQMRRYVIGIRCSLLSTQC